MEGGEIDCGVEKNSEVGKKSPVPGSTKRARGRSISFRCRKNARGVINFEHIPVRDHKNARGVQVFRFVFEKTRDGSSILKLFRSEVEKARGGSKYPVLVSKKRARGFLFWNYSGPRSKNARGVEVSRPVPGPGPGTHPHCVPSPPYEPLCKKLKGRFWCRQHGQPLDTGQPFNSGHPWIVDP